MVAEDGGVFEAGTAAAPLSTPDSSIYIKNNGWAHPNIGKRSFGGYHDPASTDGRRPRFSIYGRPLQRSWTLLSRDGQAGATTITVADSPQAMGWRVGDGVAIAVTKVKTHSQTQTGWRSQEFTITAINGNDISLSGALGNRYLGRTEHGMQAEVINLSRSFVVTGDAHDGAGHGLHGVMFNGGVFQVKDARVEKCGQLGVLGKYCLHFHQLRSCPTCEFTNNAIVDSTQRGIIVHGSHDTTVRANVFWKVRGSNLYVEDGNEMDNSFRDNVAICHDEVFEAPECKAAGTDNDFADNIQQTGLWALSVSNDFLGNRMAGHYNALFTQTTAFPMGRGAAAQKVCTHQSSFRRMEGNVQHSNWKFGFYLDSNEPRHTNRVSCLRRRGHQDSHLLLLQTSASQDQTLTHIFLVLLVLVLVLVLLLLLLLLLLLPLNT